MQSYCHLLRRGGTTSFSCPFHSEFCLPCALDLFVCYPSCTVFVKTWLQIVSITSHRRVCGCFCLDVLIVDAEDIAFFLSPGLAASSHWVTDLDLLLTLACRVDISHCGPILHNTNAHSVHTYLLCHLWQLHLNGCLAAFCVDMTALCPDF